MIGTFTALEAVPRWLGWRQEVRGTAKARPTKVPYDPSRTGAEFSYGNAVDPLTWGPRHAAERRARELANGGAMTGIGIALGDLGDGTFLAGVDLDSCLDLVRGGIPFVITQEMQSSLLGFGYTAEDILNMTPQQAHEIIAKNDCLARWAAEILTVLQTYSEVSPSGNGLKAFFLIRAEHVRPFLDLIGVDKTAWGCRRGIPGLECSNHGPAIEIYASHHFFTVTERLWSIDHQLIAPVDWPQLEALAGLIPTAASLATNNPAAKSAGGTAGPKPSDGTDNSRSARALRAALRRQPDTFEEMVEYLRNHPDDAGVREWADEVDDRQLRRLWERFCKAKAAQRVADLDDLDTRVGASSYTKPETAIPEPAAPRPGEPEPAEEKRGDNLSISKEHYEETFRATDLAGRSTIGVVRRCRRSAIRGSIRRGPNGRAMC
jgi:hypothetical protein